MKEVVFLNLVLVSTIIYGQRKENPFNNEKTETYRRISVTEKGGKVLEVKSLPDQKSPYWAKDVTQRKWSWKKKNGPYFEGPISFVQPPVEGSGEPFFPHNHQPAITWLDNGDLLAIWYTTIAEQTTELTVIASRLREGASSWDPSSEFFKAGCRNMHGSSIFNDGMGRLFHFNGMGAEGITKMESKDLAMMYRVSMDNGVSWTQPYLISNEYKKTHQPISGGFVTSKGVLIQPCDSSNMKWFGKSQKSAIFLSYDNGKTWTNPSDEPLDDEFELGKYQGRGIAGIHAGVVELKDGRLMALARRYDIEDRMPVSYSNDMGKTWKYNASPFPPIGGGQRPVLMRLNEGPIMLISFTDKRSPDYRVGLTFTDQNGDEFTGTGIFAALSFDEGETWPVRKLITPGEGDYDGGAHTNEFTATPSNAEHGGYLAATQSPDGVIHLISSRLHYRFNLEWLKTPNHMP